MPLVFQASTGLHGVYLAATMGSEATAAAERQAANCAAIHGDAAFLRLQHGRLFRVTGWIWGGKSSNPPRIFRVNWFRKDDNGRFLWPGFGENMRVLEWIVDRSGSWRVLSKAHSDRCRSMRTSAGMASNSRRKPSTP